MTISVVAGLYSRTLGNVTYVGGPSPTTPLIAVFTWMMLPISYVLSMARAMTLTPGLERFLLVRSPRMPVVWVAKVGAMGILAVGYALVAVLVAGAVVALGTSSGIPAESHCLPLLVQTVVSLFSALVTASMVGMGLTDLVKTRPSSIAMAFTILTLGIGGGMVVLHPGLARYLPPVVGFNVTVGAHHGWQWSVVMWEVGWLVLGWCLNFFAYCYRDH